jgi:hypothetical protein
MPDTDNPKKLTLADDFITVSSIAVLAFIIADMAHEGLGHGFGFYFAGGQSSMLTTTRLIEWVKLPDPQWRIFDLGGPAVTLVFALLAWVGQKLVRGRAEQLRFFLWLVMVFSLFWAFGYLIFSGASGHGDWMALIAGTRFLWLGRFCFIVIGIALYRASVVLAAKELRWIVPVTGPEVGPRANRLIWISYVSGGLIASAGSILDPQGPIEILKSGAASSFGAAIGMLFVAHVFSTLPAKEHLSDAAISRGLPWILAAAAAAIYYVGILGPGILLWFGG